MTNDQIFNELLETSWNLQTILRRRNEQRTMYPGRCELIPAEDIDIRSYGLPEHRIYEVAGQTFKKLMESLCANEGDPAAAYVKNEYEKYTRLAKNYGFYAMYFDKFENAAGDYPPSMLIQFPDVGVWKLGLLSSNGNMIQNAACAQNWYETRRIFTKQHIAVAGASVASEAALRAVRLFRPDYVSLSDPKAPNVSNFNRTNYDVFDILPGRNGEEISKAVALARKIHEQDPTQIINVFNDGLTDENITEFFGIEAAHTPKASALLEAIDNLPLKYKSLKLAKEHGIPSIQLADIGSKAVATFCSGREDEAVFFNLDDESAEKLICSQGAFALAAILMTGPSNAMSSPELHKWLTGQNNEPFKSVPQLGTTAAAAGASAVESLARYLVESDSRRRFPQRRLIVDICSNTTVVQKSVSEDDRNLQISLLNKGT